MCQVPSSEQGLSWADRKCWVWNLPVSWCQTLLVSSQQEQIVSGWIKHYLMILSRLPPKCSFCAFQLSHCLSRGALFVLQLLSLHPTEALPLSAGWGRRRRWSGQTFHKSKLWIATFICFPLQTGVMCAIVITGLGTGDYALPLEEALAVLPENLALPSEPGSSSPRTALVGKHCRQFVLAAVGAPELCRTILGIGALGHLSLHSFACPHTHLGRCCFWKRTEGNVVHEQSHG